jgi:hypothetical protein
MSVLPPGREGAMPSSDVAAFDPEAIRALAVAYDSACAVLHVANEADPRATIIAKKIIELARHGERDPIRLVDLVLTDFQRVPDAA